MENIRVKNLCGEDETTYVYDNNAKLSKLLVKFTNGVMTKYVHGRGLIGEETNGEFKTYHFDSRGSTVAITDEQGNITDTLAYDTYGKLLARTGETNAIFLYNGRDGVVTEPNGLIYMRARYYSPELRRFINADIVAGEITNAITLNRYAYANANPVSFVDPLGLSANPSQFSTKIMTDGGSGKDNRGNSVSHTGMIPGTLQGPNISQNIGSGIPNIPSPVPEPVQDNEEKWYNKVLNGLARIKDGVDTIANVISDNIGYRVSLGKEKALNVDYYFFATIENGVGYEKSFENGKPVTAFTSAGENWWEFWEWSMGIDAKIDGYGAGISVGNESTIAIHGGDVSHELGVNALGRASYKFAYNTGDGYVYEKYSLNVPETAVAIVGTVVVAYYAGSAIISALAALLTPWLGSGAPVPT